MSPIPTECRAIESSGAIRELPAGRRRVSFGA